MDVCSQECFSRLSRQPIHLLQCCLTTSRCCLYLVLLVREWYIFLTKALCHDGKTSVLKNGTCQFHLRSDIEQPPEAVALTLTSKFNHHSGWPRSITSFYSLQLTNEFTYTRILNTFIINVKGFRNCSNLRFTKVKAYTVCEVCVCEPS